VASHYQSMLLRRGELAELDASNPILASGEPAFAVDTNTLKIGNGSDAWQDLDKFLTSRDVKKSIVNVTVPSIAINQSVTLIVDFDGVNLNDKYAVFVSPDQELPSGLVIGYAFISSENEVSIQIRNTSIDYVDGGPNDNSGNAQTSSPLSNVKFYIVAHLVASTTTTTTTTTTLPPVSNSVFGFGYNEFGQLGINNNISKNEPEQIYGNHIWKNLSAGHYHSLGVDIDDDLYAFGYNYYGQLGLGNSGASTNRIIPTKVSINYIGNNVCSSGAKWTKVSAGAYHSLGIDSGNKLFAFGSNAYGSLGLGDLNARIKPIMVGEDINYLRLSSDEFFENNWNTHADMSIINGDYVLSGIKKDYTGDSKYVLPKGKYVINGITQDHPIAILNTDLSNVAAPIFKNNLIAYSGDYFAASSIVLGTAGDGTYDFYYGSIYIDVSGDYGSVSWYALHRHPDIITPVYFSGSYMGGENSLNYKDPNAGWQDISAGNYHSLGIKNGELYSFGHNTFGQLGNSSNEHSVSPVKVGTKSDWVKVKAGNYHSLALDSSGALWSFGANNYGQLGLGDNINRNIPTKVSGVWQAFEDFNFSNLSSSSSVGFDDEKFVFNYSANKQYNYEDRYLLSNGTYVISGVPSGLPIAILNDGKQNLISYSGINYHGSKTVTGTTNNGTYNFYWGNVTVKVSGDFEKVSTYTYNSGYMGGENVFYYNRTLNSWSDMSAGVDYSIALDSSNKLWAFGKNDHGQLGLGDDSPRRLPAKLPLSNWQSVDAGAHHALVVNSSKELWSFGKNNNGQLGLGDNADRYEPTKVNSEIRWATPIAGGNHSLVTVFSYYPSSPTNIVVKNGSQVSAAGSNEIEVSWTLNTSEEEGVLNYVIEFSTNGGLTWNTVTKPTSINKSYVVKNLVNNTTNYIFRVAAINYIGRGAFSVNSNTITAVEVVDNDFCNVVFMSHFDGNNDSLSFSDLSKYNWTPTREGMVKISTNESQFGGASAVFNGIAGLTFGSGVEFNMSGNFTIECFFRPTSYNFVNPQALLHGDKLLSTNNAENGWGIYSDKGVISVTHKVNGATAEILRSNITLPLHSWSHVAWVRSGLTNSLYINGTRRSQSTSSNPAPTYHDTKLDIGTRISTLSLDHRNIYGYIDEARVSKVARYTTTNYVVPTRSFGVNTCS
jgi:alpha-tubulin suppressor-like RCC1 family protein